VRVPIARFPVRLIAYTDTDEAPRKVSQGEGVQGVKGGEGGTEEKTDD
jgi:hypothetical protein